MPRGAMQSLDRRATSQRLHPPVSAPFRRPSQIPPFGLIKHRPSFHRGDLGTRPKTALRLPRMAGGDRLGLIYAADLSSVGLLLNGQLLGPLVKLKAPTPRLPGYHFFVRFDIVPGLQLQQLAPAHVPVDVGALARQPRRVPRPLGPDEPTTLVRSVGPDSRLFGVQLARLAPTVGELRDRLAVLLECEPRHLQLRAALAATAGGQAGRAQRGQDYQLLQDDRTNLDAIGVRLEPNGCQLRDVLVEIPLMIS